MKTPSPVRVALFTVALWSVLSLVIGYVYVASKLDLPPSGDTYAPTLVFQTISFVLFVGPKLILALIVTLGCEFVLFKTLRRRKRKGPRID